MGRDHGFQRACRRRRRGHCPKLGAGPSAQPLRFSGTEHGKRRVEVIQGAVMNRWSRPFVVLCFLGRLCFDGAGTSARAGDPSTDVGLVAKKLGRGINIGNALEAPKEGEWGVLLTAEYF